MRKQLTLFLLPLGDPDRPRADVYNVVIVIKGGTGAAFTCPSHKPAPKANRRNGSKITPDVYVDRCRNMTRNFPVVWVANPQNTVNKVGQAVKFVWLMYSSKKEC